MYIVGARLDYACKHGYSIEKANNKIERMTEGIPPFPSSIKFEKELEETHSKITSSIRVGIL